MYRILLVDGDDMVRPGTAFSIPWEAHNCTLVGQGKNGQEGEEMIRKFSPHIVITEEDLPQQKGLEMLESTQNLPTFVSILLTHCQDFSVAQHAVNLGVFAYLLKPCPQETLVEVLFRAQKQSDHLQTLALHQKEHTQILQTSPLTNLNAPSVTDPIIVGVLHYLHQHYSEKITLAHLAETLHYSQRYISLRFQKAFGTTVMDYLTRYRLQEALALFSDDSLSLAEIGHRCGLGDYKYFSQVFKRYFFCSPRDYRKCTTSL